MAGLVTVLACTVACRRAEAPGRSETADTSNVTGFLADANAKLLELLNEANEAGWVLGTYITVDTQAISARASSASRSLASANRDSRGWSEMMAFTRGLKFSIWSR